jgi:hypothetical protein
MWVVEIWRDFDTSRTFGPFESQQLAWAWADSVTGGKGYQTTEVQEPDSVKYFLGR